MTNFTACSEQIVPARLIFYIKVFWDSHGKLEVKEDILLGATLVFFYPKCIGCSLKGLQRLWVVLEEYPAGDLVRVSLRLGRVLLAIVNESLFYLENGLVEGILLEWLSTFQTFYQSVNEKGPSLGVVVFHKTAPLFAGVVEYLTAGTP